MKKLLVVVMILVVSANTLFAASQNESKKMTIGFSVYDMQYGFFQEMERGTREMAESLGYEFILHDQKSDEALMVSGCQDLIVQGIDALIVSPVKPPAVGPVVESAHEAGIPVILDDIGGGGSNYDAIVISDNFGGGALAGEFVIDQLKGTNGSMEVAIIKVEPSAVYAIRRGEGFKKAVTDAGYKVVSELSGHSKPEEGYSIMQDILVAHPGIQAVFAENDPMAAAAAQAAVDAGRNDIMIIGFNGDGVAMDAIKAGTMAATVQQIPYEMGKMTVLLADKAIKGLALDYDNKADREIYVPVNLITADNVE
ncbi:MAG: substrate-binding domain-containing protein [Spirochaetaceae bacterium]